jgi:pimeloyl-ACP methyl ester carboxylesterase
MRKASYYFGASILILVLVYLMGPTPDFEPVNKEPISWDISLEEVESYVDNREQKVEKLKPDNEARIVWADSVKKTPYSVVYLHGWSGSPGEGDPIHYQFAKYFGCNLYIHRFPEHGIRDSNIFANLTPTDLVESAKEAIAIGKTIGEKVILMSCSTGSTLAFYLASNNPDIHSLIAFSPNIDLADPTSDLLTKPWGLQIAKAVLGGDYRVWYGPGDVPDFWSTKYRIEGLLCLKDLVQQTMQEETFQGITQPIYVGYYYKDEEHQDDAVSIEKIHWFWDHISTPESQRTKQAFPDAGYHVFTSRHFPVNVQAPLDSIIVFGEEVLGMGDGC